MLFCSSKLHELLDSDDIVKLIVNAIPMYIKQCKFKDTISSITLINAGTLYAFPPKIVVEINENKQELDFWELKPKELHYQIDAVSGDTNIQLNGNKDKIEQLYNEICGNLNQFKWNTVCKTSPNFSISYKRVD